MKLFFLTILVSLVSHLTNANSIQVTYNTLNTCLLALGESKFET
jgi:hypothetical protein